MIYLLFNTVLAITKWAKDKRFSVYFYIVLILGMYLLLKQFFDPSRVLLNSGYTISDSSTYMLFITMMTISIYLSIDIAIRKNYIFTLSVIMLFVYLVYQVIANKVFHIGLIDLSISIVIYFIYMIYRSYSMFTKKHVSEKIKTNN